VTFSGKIREIDPLEDPIWETLHAKADYGSTLFSSTPWLRAVCDTYGLKPRARMAFDQSDRAVGGIAYCPVDDLLGRRLISFPFSDFHDPVGDLDGAAAAAESLAEENPDIPVRLKIPAGRLPDLNPKLFPNEQRLLLHHIITVTDDDADTQFAALHSQVRQNIRKGRRAGIEVELRSDIDAVRAFYELHVGVRTRKYHLLPQPYSFFEALHANFSATDDLRVALAHVDGRPVAGIVYIRSGQTLYYKFNASDTDGLKVRPNEQLIWAGIEHCIERGLTGIDLGVSDIDQPGLVRFKRKFAQIEQEVATISGTGTSTSSDAAELRGVFGQLTGLLTDPRVPADVAEQAGDILYRYFV
jgi:hypothetical protein